MTEYESPHGTLQYDWAERHFSLQTAVVDEEIIGLSDTLGAIKCYGGSFRRAICCESVTLRVGDRVKILGRIPGRNIWIVAPLTASRVVPISKPNINWAKQNRTKKADSYCQAS